MYAPYSAYSKQRAFLILCFIFCFWRRVAWFLLIYHQFFDRDSFQPCFFFVIRVDFSFKRNEHFSVTREQLSASICGKKSTIFRIHTNISNCKDLIKFIQLKIFILFKRILINIHKLHVIFSVIFHFITKHSRIIRQSTTNYYHDLHFNINIKRN